MQSFLCNCVAQKHMFYQAQYHLNGKRQFDNYVQCLAASQLSKLASADVVRSALLFEV